MRLSTELKSEQAVKIRGKKAQVSQRLISRLAVNFQGRGEKFLLEDLLAKGRKGRDGGGEPQPPHVFTLGVSNLCHAGLRQAGAATVAGCQPGFGAERGSRAVAASGSRCRGLGSVARCHRPAGDARSRRRCEGPNEIKADMSTELHRAFPTGIGAIPKP